jgi:hypothetical protein
LCCPLPLSPPSFQQISGSLTSRISGAAKGSAGFSREIVFICDAISAVNSHSVMFAISILILRNYLMALIGADIVKWEF